MERVRPLFFFPETSFFFCFWTLSFSSACSLLKLHTIIKKRLHALLRAIAYFINLQRKYIPKTGILFRLSSVGKECDTNFLLRCFKTISARRESVSQCE